LVVVEVAGYISYTAVVPGTTLSVKVSEEFARQFRAFCEAHCLQVGRFTERALLEVMEDYHFGLKAQRVLSSSAGEPVRHSRAFGKKR
jgi:hypothetical protein